MRIFFPFQKAATPVFFCLLLLAGCDTGHEEGKTDCRIDEGECIKTLAPEGMVVIFDIQPKPVRTMKRLLFRVDLKKADLPVTDAAVTLAFSMPGMYMADNRYLLEHKGGGSYEAEGVIVRCPSGRKIWQAGLVIQRPGQATEDALSVRYIFRVDK
jgi:hypothetical protein